MAPQLLERLAERLGILHEVRRRPGEARRAVLAVGTVSEKSRRRSSKCASPRASGLDRHGARALRPRAVTPLRGSTLQRGHGDRAAQGLSAPVRAVDGALVLLAGREARCGSRCASWSMGSPMSRLTKGLPYDLVGAQPPELLRLRVPHAHAAARDRARRRPSAGCRGSSRRTSLTSSSSSVRSRSSSLIVWSSSLVDWSSSFMVSSSSLVDWSSSLVVSSSSTVDWSSSLVVSSSSFVDWSSS